MSFLQPWFLLLFVPAFAWTWWFFHKVRGIAKARKRIAMVLRFILLGSLIIALAGPQIHRALGGTCVLYLVDRSASISDEDRDKAFQFASTAIEKLPPDDLGGVIAFGVEPTMESLPLGARKLPPFTSKIRDGGTDIASALRLAGAIFPEGKGRRVVLISDGNETAGDAAAAAEAAGADGIEIDTVSLGTNQIRPEASVLELSSPSEMAASQPMQLRATVDSNVDQQARFRLERDDVPIKTIVAHLNKGRSSILFTDKIEKAGLHRYRVTMEAAQDSDFRNNVGVSFTSVKGKPKILVLQGDKKDLNLVNALTKGGENVDLRTPSTLPTHPEELPEFDAIVLNDFNADNFTPQQMVSYQAAVRDQGVGLAMIGGENSFLPGGYYGSAIADTLPVDLNIKQREDMPGASICIICDVSGSMGLLEDGIPKVRIVAKAAESTVNMMTASDRVAVAGSADGIDFVAPMQQVTDKQKIIDGIDKLGLGGGGIYAYPSVKKGKEVLEQEHTKIRHFILMADGNDTETQEGCQALILAMREEKITTSCVAIGTGKDVSFLHAMALLGGGRFYLAAHANQLPAIMTQDAAIVSRRAIEEGAFLPKLVEDSEILSGIESTPALLAYDLTDTRPLADVEMKTAKDDPLLATWQYGLGSSLAFTSDAQAKWAARWVGWSGFDSFWNQAIRSISRRATVNKYEMATHLENGKGQIEVEATDPAGNPLSDPEIATRVSSPDGRSVSLALTQDSPGKYSGSFNVDQTGVYTSTVVESPTGQAPRVDSSGFAIPYPPEFRSFRTNTPLLRRVREVASGKELKDPLESLRPKEAVSEELVDASRFFLMLSTLLLPLDIAIRRIALPVGAWAKLFKKAPARASRPTPSPAAQPVPTRTPAEVPVARTPATGRIATSSPPSAPTVAAEPDVVPDEEVHVPETVSAGSKLLEAKKRRQKQ